MLHSVGDVNFCCHKSISNFLKHYRKKNREKVSKASGNYHSRSFGDVLPNFRYGKRNAENVENERFFRSRINVSIHKREVGGSGNRNRGGGKRLNERKGGREGEGEN